MATVSQYLKQCKMYLWVRTNLSNDGAFIYQIRSTGIYAILFFLPVILQKSLGFNQERAFLSSTPPAALGVIVAFTISWVADKLQLRGPFAFLSTVMGLVGLYMIGFLHDPIPRYMGTFLGQAASNSLVVTGLAWGRNNVRGDAKLAVTTALQITLSAIGGIYSSAVFREEVRISPLTIPELDAELTAFQDGPNYIPGIIAVLVLFVLTAIPAPFASWVLRVGIPCT